MTEFLEKVDIEPLHKNVLENTNGKIKTENFTKKCIYDKKQECVLPGKVLNICKNCPYGYIYFYKSILSNTYKKIVGLCILIKKLIHQNKLLQ